MVRRKPSMMGSSKYEFRPEQFDVDVAENKRKFEEKRTYFKEQLRSLIESEPQSMKDNFHLIITILREIKTERKI